MSLTKRPAETFTAELLDAAQGLVGTLAVGIYTSPEEVEVTALTTAGIAEFEQDDGTSNYQASLTAPTATGKYMIVWVSGPGSGTEDLYVQGFEGMPYVVPSIGDVAALLMQRLNVGGGNTAVVFNANTSPSGDQVQRLIDLIAPTVLIEFGDLSDDKLVCSDAETVRAAVKFLVAAYVAKAIELSYWPQDVVGRDTAESYWGALIDKQTPKVVEAARECRQGEDVPGGGAGEGGIAMKPRWQFNTSPRVGSRAF